MKKLAVAALALTSLSGCAADYYGPPGPGPLAYGGFYDDYYGPIYDGYWGDRGVFYYRTHDRARFRPDRGGHFRQDMGPGPGAGARPFHEFHGSFAGPPGRGGRRR